MVPDFAHVGFTAATPLSNQGFPARFLEEVSGVLTRKVGRDEERATQAILVIENAATVTDTPRLAEVIEGDHAGNRVLECAVAAGADYLVTGDRRHLLPIEEHQGTSIVNAPQFLSGLRA